MNRQRNLIIVLLMMILLGCTAPGENLSQVLTPTTAPVQATISPTITATSTQIIEEESSKTAPVRIGSLSANTPNPSLPTEPSVTLSPEAWKDMPVIPVVSGRTKEIYQHGLANGNNPRAFSKIGDCGSTPAWFLGDFDRGPKYYRLGDYEYLQAVIQEFQGSYERTSLAAKSGFNASSIFAPIWADKTQCLPGESPIACEYRVQKPAFALITLGTNDIWHQDSFEPQMRKIIELSIEQGIIPILATKADNLEGDESINATIARLAVEYQIPLWNYWRALQELPNQGLQKDGAHLTWAGNRFDDPKAMGKAWPIRNLTALQVLDAVWSSVTSP